MTATPLRLREISAPQLFAPNSVHPAGVDDIQAQTDGSGISTMAPMEIASNLVNPNVEGRHDSEMGTSNFSARFTDAAGKASFEVTCTNDGIGDGLIDGTGPLTHLANGIILQQTGPGQISSDWVKAGTSGDCHCTVTSEGMTLAQTVKMASSLQTFTPQSVGGAYIAQ